jgi:hypothetical protein
MGIMTDAEYQERRNALIPEAERHANRMAGDGKGFHAAKWSWIYHTTMDRLWKVEVRKEKEREGL